MSYPTIAQLALEVRHYAKELATYDPADIADEEGNPYGDVRLQIADGTWYFHTGDASFDTDHSGRWGSATVRAGASYAACYDIARDLINEARNA